jgi:F-type H+-transporting ATPase subunit b
MLEFNQWFFVLVANFVILVFVLKVWLFNPLSKVAEDRDKATKGAMDEAKAMLAKKDEAVAKMNAELNAARQQAKEIANALREEGLNRQKALLSSAEAAAVQQIENARREIQEETEKARAALKADIERFAEEIVRKLVRV